ncbi:MAG: hypothetical protein GY720_17510 [bacterium]|nr:hypothetical protein [bacterium]
MRSLVRLMALLLVVSACGGDGSADESSTTLASSTTIVPSTSLPDSSTGPGSTTLPPQSTTEAPVVSIGVQLLVSGPDGVFLVNDDGLAEQLVEGSAAFAIDDLAGGVLFQRERGALERRSVVYRVRSGSAEAIEALVPSSDQGLTLNGITGDGDTYVYYTRNEGSNIEDARQTLRRYSLETREVTELQVTGGWEAGSFPISVSESLILINWSAEVYHGMDFIDLRANSAAVAANPSPADGYEDCWECPSLGALSADGSQLVYFETVEGVKYAVVKHLASGAEIRRIVLNVAGDDWWPVSFDLLDNYLVVNNVDVSDWEIQRPRLFDLSQVDPQPIFVGPRGEAYITRSPVSIAGPITFP